MNQTEQSVPIPGALLDAIADRVAERIADRLGEIGGTSAAWMRTNDAAAHLGLTRSSLYSRIREIPHYRFERTLLFKRSDLDAWVEAHRVEPVSPDARPSAIRDPAIARPSRAGRTPATRSKASLPPAEPKQRAKRERPLPPPLGGDDARKDQWAKQLEISRAELDDMSPGDFKRAWDARNERLKAGGVFDHVDHLWQRLGQARIDAMTPSELIAAVAELLAEAARQENASGVDEHPPSA